MLSQSLLRAKNNQFWPLVPTPSVVALGWQSREPGAWQGSPAPAPGGSAPLGTSVSPGACLRKEEGVKKPGLKVQTSRFLQPQGPGCGDTGPSASLPKPWKGLRDTSVLLKEARESSASWLQEDQRRPRLSGRKLTVSVLRESGTRHSLHVKVPWAATPVGPGKDVDYPASRAVQGVGGRTASAHLPA